MDWKTTAQTCSAVSTAGMWLLAFPVAVEEGTETWNRWFEKANLPQPVDAMNILYQQFGSATLVLPITATLWWWFYWSPPQWFRQWRASRGKATVLARTSQTDGERFRAPADAMQVCLDRLNAMADEAVSEPFAVPSNWFTTRSEIIALDVVLQRLGVPRFPVPAGNDFLLEQALSWQVYLAQVTPLAREGLLEDARALVPQSVNDEGDRP